MNRGSVPAWLALGLLGAVCAQAAPPPPTSHWALVWADEFDGSEADLDRRWESQNGPRTHILCSRWRENVSVSNSLLRLVARKERRGGQDWTAGSIWTREKFLYGYFECRYRYAGATGLNNSFWLMPLRQDEIVAGKFFEIDVNEGHYPNRIHTNIHNHSDVTETNGRRRHPSWPRSWTIPDADFSKEFQVFGLMWDERELVFYHNRKELRREPNRFCHSPARVWLSLAVISWAGPVTEAIHGQVMEVDYVRIYRVRTGSLAD